MTMEVPIYIPASLKKLHANYFGRNKLKLSEVLLFIGCIIKTILSYNASCHHPYQLCV